MRPPAGARHDARHADRAAEQASQLLELDEPLAAADPPPAADDDAGVRQRHLAGLRRTRAGPGRAGPPRHAGAKDWTTGAPLGRGRRRLDDVLRDRQAADRAVERRLLEEAAGPALADEPEGLAGLDLDAVRGHRPAGERRGVGDDLVAAIRPGAEDRWAVVEAASSATAGPSAAGA